MLAFLWARVLIEPVIDRAIGFEDGVGEAHEAMAHAHGGHSHGDGGEVFTRGIQSNIGMGFGVLIFSVAMGALFAVVFCVVYNKTTIRRAPFRCSPRAACWSRCGSCPR